MTAIANNQQDRQAIRNVRIMIIVALVAVLVATTAGLVLWLAEPAEGSTTEGALGLTAAVGGLSVAALSIAAAVYAQIKGLWKYAPVWLRAAVMGLVLVGIIVTVTGWFDQLFG
jgi:hypothetical protein